MPPMNDPNEGPIHGVTVGHKPGDDLTQGRDVGEDTFDDPMRGAGLDRAPAEDPAQGLVSFPFYLLGARARLAASAAAKPF